MSHAHAALLQEFQIAIHHFVPTLPDGIKAEAQKLHDELLADENVSEDTIKRTFHDIGRKEYPFRHAYEELIATKEEGRMNLLVLEHVDTTVRSVIQPYIVDGVHLESLVSSEVLSEKLSPEQIYQVVDGIMVAKSKLAEAIKKHVSDDTAAYEALVVKWQVKGRDIEAKIQELAKMATEGDDGQRKEILAKVAHYKEGFLVTEEDPDEREIDEEIAYWKDAFTEEV